MLQNARVVTFMVSELFRENQQGVNSHFTQKTSLWDKWVIWIKLPQKFMRPCIS